MTLPLTSNSKINVSRHQDQDGTPVQGITTDNFQLNTRIDVPSLLGTVSVSMSVILGRVESQCGMVLLSRDVCDVEMFTFSPPDKYA